MTYTAQAIKKAVEGGWNDRLYRNSDNTPENEKANVWTHHSSMFLDPLFWQSLGKSMGYENCRGAEEPAHKENPLKVLWDGKCWYVMFHRFIDHLIAGHDVESFFANLLK